MKTDAIKKIEIDELERLCIQPEKERFLYIWRAAAEVHWDDTKRVLYSPKPREWSYLDWFKQIINVIEKEYNCQLEVTPDTNWINIPAKLQIDIRSYRI